MPYSPLHARTFRRVVVENVFLLLRRRRRVVLFCVVVVVLSVMKKKTITAVAARADFACQGIRAAIRARSDYPMLDKSRQ